jgi:hypothetical protein
MSANDMRFDFASGRIVRGALNMNVDEMQALRDKLAADIQTEQDKELPMLTGAGFLVIDPKNPRFTGQEYATKEAAEEEANDVAYASGRAIIYVPIAVVRPKREIVTSQPSELLKQIMRDSAQVASIPAPEKGDG